MKPITYLVCYLTVLAYGLYAVSVHRTTFSWLIVLSAITVGLAVFVRLGLGFGQTHKISWRRTALHGRIRPVVHRHF